MTASVASVGLVALLGCLILYFELRATSSEVAELEGARSALEERWKAADTLIASLRRELDDARSVAARRDAELAELRERLRELEARRLEEVEARVATEGADGVRASDGARAPYVLIAIEDADAMALSALQAGDLETLWLLAADLLRWGEPGYEKLIELAAMLDAQDFKEKLQLWNEPEYIVGPFLRAVLDNSTELARFGLHLKTKSPKELPEILGDFRDEIDGSLGGIMLGMWDGDDPNVLDGYTDIYEKAIRSKEPTRNAERAVRALAHLGTDRSRRVLTELVEKGEGPLFSSAVRSLAWRGGDEEAAVLGRVLEQPELSDEARETLERALRYLTGAGAR